MKTNRSAGPCPIRTWTSFICGCLDARGCGQVDECRPLVKQVEATVRELIEQVDGLSIEVLRDQASAAGHRDRTAARGEQSRRSTEALRASV